MNQFASLFIVVLPALICTPAFADDIAKPIEVIQDTPPASSSTQVDHHTPSALAAPASSDDRIKDFCTNGPEGSYLGTYKLGARTDGDPVDQQTATWRINIFCKGDSQIQATAAIIDCNGIASNVGTLWNSEATTVNGVNVLRISNHGKDASQIQANANFASLEINLDELSKNKHLVAKWFNNTVVGSLMPLGKGSTGKGKNKGKGGGSCKNSGPEYTAFPKLAKCDVGLNGPANPDGIYKLTSATGQQSNLSINTMANNAIIRYGGRVFGDAPTGPQDCTMQASIASGDTVPQGFSGGQIRVQWTGPNSGNAYVINYADGLQTFKITADGSSRGNVLVSQPPTMPDPSAPVIVRRKGPVVANQPN